MESTTQLLRRLAEGDTTVSEQLYDSVYHELRRLAGSAMVSQKQNHTLQPTALVHEAYLRLIDQAADVKDRTHFMSVAALAMRQILVSHARKRNAAKRGEGWRRVTSSGLSSSEPDFDLVSLDEALTELTDLHERQARVVELRFFTGLSIAETAELLGIGTTTVKDDWIMARTWLASRLRN